VAVAKGTTNAYIVEELTGEKIDKSKYVAGVTKRYGKTNSRLPDLVLKDGKALEKASTTEALKEMGPGDVFAGDGGGEKDSSDNTGGTGEEHTDGHRRGPR